MYFYPVVFSAQRKGFTVTVPDIPEAITQGDSEEEARSATVDAIETALGEYMRRKLDIPVPSRPRRGMRTIQLPLLTQAKLSLYMELRSGSMRKAELARRAGISKAQVERLLDLDHHSRLDQVEAAFAAIGKRLAITLENAA